MLKSTPKVPTSLDSAELKPAGGSAKLSSSRPAPRLDSRQRVNVAVLVDLIRYSGAGGHVKAWERFAHAARSFDAELDMTVYYLGEGTTEERLADHVRIRTVPPAFGTASLPWLQNGGGDTDLASYNPYLARQLLEHDVLHATSAFAFARTARTVARTHGRPLVSSLHTDAAKFAKVYTGEIIEKLAGHSVVSRWLIDGVGLPEISARKLDRARDRILEASDHILVSDPADERRLHASLPDARISYLRRGIDRALFSPEKRDRLWLLERHGVPIDVPVLMFAGRVDESKRVLTVAKAARMLLDEGRELHVLIAGEGSEQATIKSMLGERATLAGNVTQSDLARLMASADIFVFPSESEIVSNVVIEAKASGLPVIVTGGATTSQLVSSPGVDGLLTDNPSIEAYAEAVGRLLTDPDRRRRIGRDARIAIETTWPDWTDVLAEDLLPVWRDAKARFCEKWRKAGHPTEHLPAPAKLIERDQQAR
jgi:glycosyltransferase involved in cell wall biosynthesis